jgi:hypothetical protein
MNYMPFVMPIVVFLITFVPVQTRNFMVYRFRMKLLDRIVPGSPEFRAQMDEFQAVSYPIMFLKFWKPLASFYPADGLLRRLAKAK